MVMERDEVMRRAADVRLVIFDVDGVLTDGNLYFGDDGQEYKSFNSKDGLGMKLLRDSGVEIGVITARQSQVVNVRMRNLGVEHVYQGQQQKLPAYQELLEKLSLTPEQVAYVGDDLIDLPIMRRVGLSVTVQDAHRVVAQQAHWQTAARGGRGAAREVCELLLEAQGNLQSTFDRFL